jgi:hypothetical protein
MSEHNQMHLRLAQLVRELDVEGKTELDHLLTDLTQAAVHYVPGADAAGMTVVERGRRVRTIGATTAEAEALDSFQEQHGDGPCLSAAWEHHTVRVDDFTSDERWPLFLRDAVAGTEMRSSLSFMMFTDRGSMGALNLYARAPHSFTEESVELGLVFATHGAVLWGSYLRENQFRSALASRDLIGQAKGMLMERFSIDATHAFSLLTRLSQESNARVVDVAGKIIDAEAARRMVS